jgi:phosphohistidine phosphatase
MAQWMRDQRLAPDLVLCSTAARARETLDLVRPALAGDPEIGLEEELYLASAGQLLERLRAVPPATAGVLLVGHNPGLHELAALLPDVGTGPLARRLADGFPTAALAVYDVPVAWSGLGRRRARLVGFVAPKDLRRGLGS